MSRLLRKSLHAMQGLVPKSPGGVTILGYHLVGAKSASCINLPLDTFREQLEELTRISKVIHLSEALSRLGNGQPITEHLVVLTFDDGYKNFYTQAWPILRELELPSTLYAHVDFLKGDGDGPISNVGPLAPLSWDELNELAQSGLVQVGSHTCSHTDLPTLSTDAVIRELEVSKKMLEERLGMPVDSFCYPRGQWSPQVEREVANHYDSAVIRGGRTMRAERFSPLRLERVPIRSDMPASIRDVVESTVWLEEWFAAGIRRVLPPRR